MQKGRTTVGARIAIRASKGFNNKLLDYSSKVDKEKTPHNNG
jgi:hypothetical protein